MVLQTPADSSVSERSTGLAVAVLNAVRFEVGRQYNAAWEAACPLTGTPDSIMKTAERPKCADLNITDAIPIGISVLAPDGATLYVNRTGLDNLGVPLDEVIDKGHLERTCHPNDLERVLNDRSMGLSKGVPFELEMRLSAIGQPSGFSTGNIDGIFLSTTP